MLLRHAKSDWDDPALGDFDRPLSPRGRAAALAMGRELRRQDVPLGRILASPAARVIETLAGLAEGYGGPIDAEYDRRVYLASADTLLDIVRAADDSEPGLLIVGHNPGVERLALLLSRGGGLRDEMADKYPTGTLARIALPVDRWRDVAGGTGTLELFIRPRDLGPGLGPAGEAD